MTDAEGTAVRQQVDALIAHAKSDGAYAARLREDPQPELSAAGFDGELLETLSREIAPPDVEGFARCTFTCDRFSCAITSCGYFPLSN